METLTTPIPGLTIRALTGTDSEAVRALAADCPEWKWPKEELEECLHCSEAVGRVAEVDGLAIGFLIYRLDPSLHAAFIKNLVVAPAWRRRRVGWTLLNVMESEMPRGFDRVAFLVPEASDSLQLLLRGRAFRAVRVLRNWFEDEHAYIMEKKLGPAR
jgi:ribosomal protein S18 acetylase RimI-like enzyme